MTGNPLANQLSNLLELAGVQQTPQQLLATAAQIAANIPNNLIVPALIWAIVQVNNGLPKVGDGLVFAGNYGGVAPTFTPSSAGAIAIDTVTRRQWQWAAGTWS